MWDDLLGIPSHFYPARDRGAVLLGPALTAASALDLLGRGVRDRFDRYDAMG